MPPLPSTFDYRPPTGPIDIVYEDDAADRLRQAERAADGAGQGSLARRLPRGAGAGALSATSPTTKVVHRLDKDTSGLLLLAFDKKALGALGSQFEHRQIEKYYVARVWGEVDGDSGLDRSAARHRLGEQAAPARRLRARPRQPDATGRCSAREPGVTRMKLTPLTGRTHQLRVHMLALGHPILGDSFYADGRGAATPPTGCSCMPKCWASPTRTTHAPLRFVAPAPF